MKLAIVVELDPPIVVSSLAMASLRRECCSAGDLTMLFRIDFQLSNDLCSSIVRRLFGSASEIRGTYYRLELIEALFVWKTLDLW